MESSSQPSNFARLLTGDWSQRLAYVVDMMRDVSRQTDPQAMVKSYGKRMREIMHADGSMSLSRRELTYPYYRITRSSQWGPDHDPWKSRDKLPLLKGGLLAEMIYGEEPVVIDNLDFADDDPAADFLRGHKSLVGVPMYDSGHALNMVILMRDQANAFDRELFAEHVWVANLFGRATHNLLLSGQLREAYDEVDRELKVVADIQRSLLPVQIPNIPTLDLAAHYQTSRRAGGDYYDFFPLPNGKWGFLIADVSGHGTPAAVIMAVTHSIAHTHDEMPDPPSKLLNFINRHLVARYTNGSGTFVTAFYGIYDPKTRSMIYANAGHNPPRHKRAGQVVLGSLEGDRNFPLGIEADEAYVDSVQTFAPGDSIVFYTDGITEARAGSGAEMFGVERLDQTVLAAPCEASSQEVLDDVLKNLEAFTGGAAPNDDRTLLLAKVS
jgi:sigma-B regulation protein RsbU (phosphoserine phosphatase)